MHSSFYSSSSSTFPLFDKIEEVKRAYQEKQVLISQIKTERIDSLNNSNLSLSSSKSHLPEFQSSQKKSFNPSSKPQSFLSDLNDSGKESLRIYLMNKDKNHKAKKLKNLKKPSTDLKQFIDEEFTALKSEIAGLFSEKKENFEGKERFSDFSKKSSDKSLVTVMNGSGYRRNSEVKLSSRGSKVQSRKNSELGVDRKGEQVVDDKKDSEVQSEVKVFSMFTSSIQVLPERKKEPERNWKREVLNSGQNEDFLSLARMEKWVLEGKKKFRSRKVENQVAEKDKIKDSQKLFSGFKFDTNYLKSYMDPLKSGVKFSDDNKVLTSKAESKQFLTRSKEYKSVLREPKKVYLSEPVSNKTSEKKPNIESNNPLVSKQIHKKPVVLVFGLKDTQKLSDHFEANKMGTIFHIKSRQQQIPKVKRILKSASTLLEIRKRLLKSKRQTSIIEESSEKSENFYSSLNFNFKTSKIQQSPKKQVQDPKKLEIKQIAKKKNRN